MEQHLPRKMGRLGVAEGGAGLGGIEGDRLGARSGKRSGSFSESEEEEGGGSLSRGPGRDPGQGLCMRWQQAAAAM